MGRIAFVFSGQGDQHPGMGKELYESYESAKAVFSMCDALRPGTSEQCFDGTEEQLKETKNTQPCLFATELAAADVLISEGIKPDAVAGFSLGEVVAATVAGIFDRETGFRLICKRGELMQEAALKHETSMVAVVKLTPETVTELCSKFPEVYPVNFNCPGQISVSGLLSSMKDFCDSVKAAGGRAIPLKVAGAFHSPFMNEAADAFAAELAQAEIFENSIDVYSNVTAEPYSSDVRGLLSRQICSPVQWERIVRRMIASGIDTFIEIGPGKTLTNMIKKTDPEVKVYPVTELQTILSELKG